MDRFIKLLISAGIVLSSLTLVMAQDQEKTSEKSGKPTKDELLKARIDVDNPKTLEKVKEETRPSEAKPAEKKTRKEITEAKQKKTEDKAIAIDKKKGFFRRLFSRGGSDE